MIKGQDNGENFEKLNFRVYLPFKNVGKENKLLRFNIKELRGFDLKKHEVYISFEVIDTKEKLVELKDFVRRQYISFVRR